MDVYGRGLGTGRLMSGEVADEGSGKMVMKDWFKPLRPRTGATASK